MSLLETLAAATAEATALTDTVAALQAANAAQNGRLVELEATVKSQDATIAELKTSADRDAITIAELTRQRDHAVEWGKQVAAEYQAHLATHAPAVPPVTVALQIAGAAQPTAFSLTPAHVEAPFRNTARYELPLSDGLVFVLLDTPAHGHASYIVERRKPGVFGAALPLLDYTVTIVDPRYGFEATESVAGHGQWQRWRKQNKPWPRGELDPRLVFGVDPRNKPGATVNEVPAIPEPTPLFTGGLKPAMGTTGLRNDIGTHTAWLAKAIRTGDWGDALRNAEAAASIPWHVRDDAGQLVVLTGPDNLGRMTRTNYASPLALANMIDENVGWIMDQAHAPKAAWSGFVANSADPDPFWIEELQFEAGAMVNQTHPTRKGPDGLLITNDQGRDWTWGLVSLTHAEHATPESVPDWLRPRSFWRTIIDANLAAVLPHVGRLAFDRVSVRAVDPNYGSETAGVISQQSFVIDYVPLAMLHCHRLSGDPRFKDIGVRHMDARIAKRFRASPKYAFLYAPVTIGDGTKATMFATWPEAYKAKRWISDETTPWASFLRPTGKETDATGKLLMSYSDPFVAYYLFLADLYRAEGWSTPDIDWLAAFLEGKRGSAIINLNEQFAVA